MAKTQPATLHQAYQQFPNVDVPFVDQKGRISQVWFNFLMTLWQKAGCGTSTLQGQVYLNNEDGDANAFQSFTGKLIGTVPIPGTPAADTLTLTAIELGAPGDVPRLDPLLWAMLAAPPDTVSPDQTIFRTLEVSSP